MGEIVARLQGVEGSGTDAVDIETARKRVRTLGDGTAVVESTVGQSLGAWAVDFSLVAVLAAIALISLSASGAGTVSGAAAAAVGVWVGAPWLYGFCCPGGTSLGSLASNTQLVRVDTGRPPGSWRAGWVMFARMVLFPVVILFYALAAAGGSSPSGDGPRTRHLTVDRRFPRIPAHLLPGPVTVVRPRQDDQAAVRHAQLPGLYGQRDHRG